MSALSWLRREVRRAGAGPTLGLILVSLFFVMAIFGPLFAPCDPLAQDIDVRLAGPSWKHLLGTDDNGRDLFSELLFGARLAAAISTAVVAISFSIGLTLGVIAGYFGGLVDEAIMRVVDVLLAFPGLLLNIAIVALVAHPGSGDLVFALAVNGWVGYARVARGQVLQIREREYVQAARALGAPAWRVMARHIAPNVLTPLVVQATFGFAGVILVEASLAFLGIGRLTPYSWGALLEEGRTYLWVTSRLALAPGLCMAGVVLGCNLLGDGLRDRLDPKRSR